MNFYRSQTMHHYKLIIPRESAWNVMNELAEKDCIHFVDYDPLLPTISRPFANYIKRCDDLLSKLDIIEHEVKKYSKKITYCKDVNVLIGNFRTMMRQRSKASHTYLEEVENDIEKKHLQLIEQSTNMDNLHERRNKLIEHKAVLLKGEALLGQSFFQPANYIAEGYVNLQGKELDEIKILQGSVKFNYLVGVISKEDQVRFKRIIFRITKGNAWMNTIDIESDQIVDIKNDDAKVIKSVFVVVYPGGGGSNIITNKLNKICESFQVAKYTFPENNMMFQERLRQIESDLIETRNLLEMTKNQVEAYLDEFSKVFEGSNCSQLEELKLFLVKEKYLYTQLNYFRVQGSVLYGSIWLPQGADIKVDQALRDVQTHYEGLPTGQLQIAVPDDQRPPPTYFETNEVTWGFQEIVNTYGIPRYKEINPGLFTVMTFPFLFGVMFADIGHGFCLLMLGLYLCIYNHQIKDSDSILKYALIVRHMVLMMGVWAFYNGWIYNDFMSVPIDLFGSCYEEKPVVIDNVEVKQYEWVMKDEGCVYPFGIDPVWLCVPNSLTFLNSYKMKLAVIIGVIQMTFGIILKGFNSFYFSNWIDLIFEFIPQLIFFICTFGFMDFLIIFKWTINWTGNTENAPSIITLMIGMILSPGDVVQPLWGEAGHGSEASTQTALLLIALFCIPIILLPKPLLLNYFNKQNKHESTSSVNSNTLNKELYEKINEEQDQQNSQIKQSESSHEEFGDIFVHQVIETIEFVLGSISNTASYLRLWALSLAHGQLSEVFFQMCVNGGISHGGFVGAIKLLFGYAILSLATFGVLMMMDVMECFLHALRLHWVEFQSKFFKADGYAFEKCSYSKVLSENAAPKEE